MRINYEKRDAVRIKVEMRGDIGEYAKNFLTIYNNVKNDKDLLKMYNDYGNGVYVVCETTVKDAAVEFLKQFGEIVRVENVEVVQAFCLDYDYLDDKDTEFLALEEEY